MNPALLSHLTSHVLSSNRSTTCIGLNCTCSAPFKLHLKYTPLVCVCVCLSMHVCVCINTILYTILLSPSLRISGLFGNNKNVYVKVLLGAAHTCTAQ